jgi:hypothetical protein
MELDAVVRESMNQWSLCGEHRLIITGLMAGIDVKLSIQRQVIIGLMVVLVSLHMFEGRINMHGLQRDNDFIGHVPVGLQCSIRKGV